MGRPAKIDIGKLKSLHGQGMTSTNMAKQFGCSQSAVSQQLKKLKLAATKNVIVEQAPKVVAKHLRVIDQLKKINDYANELLDLLMRWNRGEPGALQVLESAIRTKKIRIGEEERFIEEVKFKDPRELAVKIMAEIRGQLGLQMDIFKILYDIEAMAEFQREVLDVIGQLEPNARDRIIKTLKKNRALRQSVSID